MFYITHFLYALLYFFVILYKSESINIIEISTFSPYVLFIYILIYICPFPLFVYPNMFLSTFVYFQNRKYFTIKYSHFNELLASEIYEKKSMILFSFRTKNHFPLKISTIAEICFPFPICVVSLPAAHVFASKSHVHMRTGSPCRKKNCWCSFLPATTAFLSGCRLFSFREQRTISFILKKIRR